MKFINIGVVINLLLSFLLFTLMDLSIGADPFAPRYMAINILLAVSVAYLFFILAPLADRNP